MKATTAAPPASWHARTAAAVAARHVPWGFPELFVITQTAIPAILYLPGTQPFRLYVRVASFAIASAALAWCLTGPSRTTRPHQAQPWIVAIILYIAAMLLHPLSVSTTAGLAQIVLYLSVIAPFFWAPAFIRGADHVARLIALLLICNGINAAVGVLQVYDPVRWMPAEMSRLVTESAFGLGSVTYIGPTGERIIRPPGLFDNPGAVAGPGMYAALLGLVFAISAIPWWQRIAALGASFAGIAAIYLSQVRVSLVMTVLMFGAYVTLLMMQNRRGRATLFGGVAGALVVGSFSFALVLGGESIAERTLTLFAEDPVSLYAASRGGQLVYTFEELLQQYPLGAGLGRWGMVAAYFGGGGTPESAPLWAEIQVAAWAIDGGVVLLLMYIGVLVVTLATEAQVALKHRDPKVRACAAVVLAANLGTTALIFSFTPFVTQIGLQFWFLAGAIHAISGPPPRANA
jgi:hypothetical protein